jgi:predicted transcriptional regulator
VAVITKKRCTFMIDPEILARLQSITARTGLSKSEQIRQGIRWWLESREWPSTAERSGRAGARAGSRPRAARASKKRR